MTDTQAVLEVLFGGPFCNLRRMPAQNRRLTAAPGVSHTPQKPVGFPILRLPEGARIAAEAMQLGRQISDFDCPAALATLRELMRPGSHID